MKATVNGVGTVTNATLRIYSIDINMNVDVYASSNAWDEGTITWNNAPGSTGGSLDNVDVTTGWTDFDVTAAVSGDGTYTFVLKGNSDSGGRDFRSSEHADAPELIITHE